MNGRDPAQTHEMVSDQTPDQKQGEGIGPIGPLLLGYHASGFSGLLHIDGAFGGSIWFRNGLVVAAATSAAPGSETLLLRSGRIPERAWSQAYDTGASSGRLAEVLIERGLIGEAGLQAICLSALFDAVFSMALTGVGEHRAEPADSPDRLPLLPVLPVLPGLDPARLIRETARRLSIASDWRSLELSVHCRPLPAVTSADPPPEADHVRRQIVLRATGRRTPRDIAFAIGHGLFAVMDEIARMTREGVLLTGPSPSVTGQWPTDPANGDRTAGAGHPDLPRRARGASKINEVLSGGRPARPPLLQRLRALRPVPPPIGRHLRDDSDDPGEPSEDPPRGDGGHEDRE